MNDPKVSASALRELVEGLKNASTLVERAALFSAIRLLCDDFANADDDEVNGYTKEKAAEIRWHSAAALGFDITNGHSAEQHRVWALGSISSLEDSISN